MILKLLLLAAVICTAVYADTLPANDEQTCTKLCNSCQGTATFVDGRCECYISDEKKRDDACMMRIKRQADDIGMNLVDCETASGERSARCSLLGASKRLRISDAERIAKYFMDGGPVVGSPMLGAAKCDTDKVLSAPNPQIGTAKCDTDNVLGAPNLQIEQQKIVSPPKLIAAAPKLCAPPVQPASPSTGACHQVPQNILGSPLGRNSVYSPYNYLQSPRYPLNPPNPLQLPAFRAPQYPILSPQRSALPLTAPLGSHLPRHSLLGAPKVKELEKHSVGAPQCYTPPSQMIKNRPEILSSPGPIVQPGYTHSPQTRTFNNPEMMTCYKEILTLISNFLWNNAVNFGIPWAFSQPNLGAPAPKSENCGCNGQQMIQAPVLGSPNQNVQYYNQEIHPNKQRCTRMSPTVETLVEEGKNIEKTEKKEKEQVEKVEETKKVETLDETAGRPKREPRPNVNGRKRKRELKKLVDNQSS